MLDWSGVWRLLTALVGFGNVWKRGGGIDDLCVSTNRCLERYPQQSTAGDSNQRLGVPTRAENEGEQ
jgi:hypothetical protein